MKISSYSTVEETLSPGGACLVRLKVVLKRVLLRILLEIADKAN